jgi:redox-sensing transcriptional repressor
MQSKDEKSKPVRGIPEPALRRLPMYHQYLKTMEADNVVFISCTAISSDLDLVPIQVRKDIEMTGITGRPKIGYNVKQLIAGIEEFLGWHNTSDVFIAGAGSLGSAILGYQGFKEYGINILAAFDTDPKKIGTTIHGKPVYSMEKMTNLIKRMKIRMGVITVPAPHAQETADIMTDAGIKAIWNFAPVKLIPAGDVIIHNENLASSLAVLSKKLKVQEAAEVNTDQTTKTRC